MSLFSTVNTACGAPNRLFRNTELPILLRMDYDEQIVLAYQQDFGTKFASTEKPAIAHCNEQRIHNVPFPRQPPVPTLLVHF